MPIMFNKLLEVEKLSLADVRLLRHQDNKSAKGRTPYELWRDDRQLFDLYQSRQSVKNRPKLNARYWASFVGTPSGETLFVGVYGNNIDKRRLLEQDTPMVHKDGVDKAGTCDIYDLTLEQNLGDLVGKLLIDWGPGFKAWIQHAYRRNKPIIELRTEFKEPTFPGFLAFKAPLSGLDRLPETWKATLKSSRGVYLLTWPKAKPPKFQYVGSATGTDGFWGRWQNYLRTGDGGVVALKDMDPNECQVSILEVAGTAWTEDDILDREYKLWKPKLQNLLPLGCR